MNTEIDTFLKLPDWKKIELKSSDTRYLSFPLMSRDEEVYRRSKLEEFIKHFKSIETKANDLNFDFPEFLNSTITPKLIDHLDEVSLKNLFKCYFCTYFQGYTKLHHSQLHLSKKVIPFTGKCQNDRSHLKFTLAKNICSYWFPNTLHAQIISGRVYTFLEKSPLYSKQEYIHDLMKIDLLTYFSNSYKPF